MGYATGTIEECGNEACNAGVCVLNDAWINFENDIETDWSYCDEQDIFFCVLCKPSTIKFLCCDTIQYVTEDRKCWGKTSKADITMCHDETFGIFGRLMSYKCNFCDDVEHSDDERTCEECGKWACTFHRKLFKCIPNRTHNLCCIPSIQCSKCNHWMCTDCDGPGAIMFCEECKTWFCKNEWECGSEAYSCWDNEWQIVCGGCAVKERQ